MPADIKAESIAREIFSQVRTTIVLNMRFMDMAVFRLKPVPESVPLATDGENLYYDTVWLLKRFRGEPEAVTRDYLHVLLHCVFRHPFVNTLVDHDLWNLACDIAVEGLICELGISHFATRLEAARRAVVDELRGEVKPLSAEKLYRYFQDHKPYDGWFDLFHADEHDIWYNPAEAEEKKRSASQQQKQNSQSSPQSKPGTGKRDNQQNSPDQQNSQGDRGQDADNSSQNGDPVRPDGGEDQTSDASQGDGGDQGTGEGQKGNQDSGNENGQSDGQGADGGSQNSENSGRDSDAGSQAQDGAKNANPNQSGSNSQGSGAGSSSQDWTPSGGNSSSGEIIEPQADFSARQALENEWRDISEHVQMDLETFSKQQGIEAGGMQQLLGELNREKYDYEAFLKKFAVTGEVMKINDDEFDYIFYTYGLKLFKNMPLIEPLEYKEVKRIREFVIAIDTSGSTSGELVNRFLTKTYNILMSTESFFSKINIHIIQCDAVIQEAVKITKREDLEDYINQMTIKGLGGTDFRPVFAYVDQLVRQHEFKHLKGLIYFTDGCGTFPEHKPEYSTAFVFIQDGYNNLNVPPWAIKLILDKEEV